MGYPEILDKYRLAAEEALTAASRDLQGPRELREAMEYALLAGGKRVRPVLVLATRDLFPDGELDPRPAACALEFIHTYSLIHDDLPAMDDDDFRRGRPSCHKKFGEAMAILAGDALLTEAFGLLGRAWRDDAPETAIDLVTEFATAAGSAGMVGGQVLDTEGTGSGLTQAQLEEVHRCKTGALLRLAVRAGAILGGAAGEKLANLTSYAERIGLAFQVADDILDVVADEKALGKTVGKDAAQGKTTYVSLLGIEGARAYARELLDGSLSDLSGFGPEADTLRTMARFIVERTF